MTHKLSSTVYLVEVPEGASDFTITTSSKKWPTEDFLNSTILYRFAGDHQGFENLDGFKPGQWSIVGLASECTEEQAMGLVEGLFDRWYMDYSGDKSNGWAPGYTLDTALESLLSFCRSVNVPSERLLIIKKK